FSILIPLLIIGLIGGGLGLAVAFFWPVTYTAKLTFVVEEGKSSGGGILSSLAGQMGFDIGGLTGGTSGVLAGDNVLQLLTSQKMVKQTILTPLDTANKAYTIADKYADAYKLKEDWKDLKANTKKENIMFPPDTKIYTRLQDSLLHDMITRITEKELSVKFEVKDTGIGISKEKQSIIFDRFTQADSSTSRSFGGTGLGLAISKRILDLQGSSLEVESKENSGSTFYFIQRFQKTTNNLDAVSTQRNLTKEEEKLFKGISILLVEDNAINVMVARSFLQNWGAEVDVAETICRLWMALRLLRN
ncbi:MAG: hypothetical protein EOO07_11365, partial [Chitinophagaceae bacterium]